MKSNNILMLLLVCFFTLWAQEAVSPDTVGMREKFDSSGVRPCPFIPGDAIRIMVFPDTNTFPSGTYFIDGEGYVDLPIIGYLKITTMTIQDLTELLKKTYIQFVRFPYIIVRPLMRVSLFGGFVRPGLYYVDPHATLWEAIRCGGITQRRDGLSKIVWERDHSVVKKDIVPLFKSQSSLYQLGFQSGDRLSVTLRPENTRWEVFRAEVLPILTLVMSTALSAATLYQTYSVLQETRRH
jgi:protein involved in polysaccharide export with SLBB domain